MRTFAALVVLAVLLGAAACGGEESSPPTTTGSGEGSDAATTEPEATTTERDAFGPVVLIETAGGDEVVVAVEVADSADERQVGLMGRESLPEDAGMIFLFGEDTSGGFWMKDTLIPLSIAFWDTDGRVIALLDMQPCTTDPCPTYAPAAPFIGAVEANLGWFEEHGVAVGDVVELEERAYA